MRGFDTLLLMLALCACTKEAPSQVPEALTPMTFRGSVEASTRTSLGSGYSTVWSDSDKITLFSSTGTAGSTFSIASTEAGGTIATFTGLSPQSANGYYYALYPALSSARLTSDSGTVSAAIPTSQNGVEGSFAPEAALALARVNRNATSDSDILHFKNVGALLSFTVPGNYINRVKIESRDKNVCMTGPAVIDYGDGEPSVAPSDRARNYVEVNVPTKTAGKRFYAVVYPGNYSGGFTVSFYTAANYYNRYTSSVPLDLHRNANVLLIDRNWTVIDDRDTATESGYEQPDATPMNVSISSTAENYYNFIVNYSIEGVTSTGVEHGLIFSYTSDLPTCGLVGTEGKLPGPVITSTGTVNFTQCVPNSILRPGQPCYIRAYCYNQKESSYAYSPVSVLTLPAQPAASSISSTPLDSPSGDISLCSFTADGTVNGYYARSDCSGSVKLAVYNAPMGTAQAKSMKSQQASSGALVLMNGQIFGGQGNIGLAYSEGELRYNNSSSDGIANCRGYSNTYTTTWQPITRAILGIDASGNPGAYWCSLIDGNPYFFDRPIPAGTAGSAVYPQVTASSGPGPARSWSPQEALSTGPMLLYGGN
ncbi:MAG: hypothetical protein J5533_03740, partial [Bacteroidales bacterium]|nr:hypothetical protein [Bacteroidales bacterium]